MAVPSTTPVSAPHRPCDEGSPALSLVIVGGGPRGTGLLERIAANAPELLPAEQPLTIHVVDPHPPGAGRVWRYDQSPLLRMNSMAEDVTMFTDEAGTFEGPVRPGPSLAQWAARVRAGTAPTPVVDPDILAEIRALAPTDFPTRRLQSAYLAWVYAEAVAALPDNVSLRFHATTATAVTEAGAETGTETGAGAGVDDTQLVHLATGETLTADLVVLTLGHLDADPDTSLTPEQRDLAAFSARHGRTYLPPDFSADSDLSAIRPGEHVLLRGFGLAFIDLMVLLTEGRGGSYRATGLDGSLRYLRSGQEPVLHVGSGRGVPYHAKTGYRLQGPVPPLPRFFDAATVDGLLDSPRPLDFRTDVWPLLAKEIAWGHAHELFHAHPERTTVPWAEVDAAFARHSWYSRELADFLATAVPDPADRIDFEALDRPLAGRTFDHPAALRDHLTDYIRADLARRSDPACSADLGAFHALLSIYGQLPRLAGSGRITARSLARDLDGWWHGFFSFLASGPPGHRLQELLALVDAGLVRFLGPDVAVSTDDERGVFLASSPAVPGVYTEATALIEARLPRASLHATGSQLLRRLHAAGEAVEEIRTDPRPTPYVHRSGLVSVRPETGGLLTADGAAHPRRLALGAHTNGRAVAAFSRPRTNSPAFRQNDSAARSLLRTLASLPAPRTNPRAGRVPSVTA